MTDAPAKAGERPARIRLSRAKGWRMPENTVKVDRSTGWGNPFLVGDDGTAAECVDLYRKLIIGGLLCMSTRAPASEQRGAMVRVAAGLHTLRGKNLACWCALDKPCHADVLLEIANAPLPAARDAAMKEGG
jgi:hypothetical protein